MLSSIVFAQTNEELLIKDLKWRSIGPANMSGRISDVEALNDDFATLVVGSASGGVWLSKDAGTTFKSIFDSYGAASIGDVAISQKDPDIIWVGTGEKNPRNSIAWGNGIYKTTNGGESFECMGLEDTHSISTILIHPDKNNTVYAAAGGHLWGYSGDRGLFKTTNGGRTWKKLTNGLPDDGKTGAIDLIMHPNDPKTMYVAFWQRIRRAYRFDSGGPNGGIFKSTDGGDSWTKLTDGLPEGYIGKIGLAISLSDPDVLMAIVEHGVQLRRNSEDYEDMSKLGTGIYRSENGGRSWKYMNRFNNRPFYYSHIYINPQNDKKVYVLYSGFSVSEDGGKTLKPGPSSIHGDYHTMWFDPNNGNRYYLGGDGGVGLTHDHQHYIFLDNLVLSQFYAVGADMRDPYYVYGGLQDNGTWGGPSNSRDSRGILTDHWSTIGGGDGFHAQVDPTDWRTVYLESQGGAIRRVNVETRESASLRPRGPGGGGRGGQQAMRPGTQQAASNITNYEEYATDEVIEKQRAAGWGRNPFRFNWSAPIVMSPHNPRTIYFAGNHLFKSVDRGDTWTIISPDLTTNDPVKIDRNTGGITLDRTGAENHCNIVTVSESPLKPGLIWVGTDDGNVQLTRNGGATWNNLTYSIPDVPRELWVSRVEASHFEEGTAYVTYDGHRSDNFQPWVFKTEDFGETWLNISSNIPDGQVIYVIKEDLKNPNLLFIGTEFNTFYTINGGQSWTELNKNMPIVAVHDLLIHPRDNDLIAATHGRGIWIMDDITPLQQATMDVLGSEAELFDSKTATRWLNISRGGSRGDFVFGGENPASGAAINYYIGSGVNGKVDIEIIDVSGENKRTYSKDAVEGINRIMWDMSFDPTEQQIRRFVSSLPRTIERMMDRVSGDAQKRMGEIAKEVEEAGNDVDKLSQLQTEMFQLMGFGGGRRMGGIRGTPAPAGDYLVKMTVNGTTYTRSITLRDDPLLKK
ncbi:MAG: hypothetical protein GY863_17765 [bacterium]|nr:hypothetical protein [bacterium]